MGGEFRLTGSIPDPTNATVVIKFVIPNINPNHTNSLLGTRYGNHRAVNPASLASLTPVHPCGNIFTIPLNINGNAVFPAKINTDCDTTTTAPRVAKGVMLASRRDMPEFANAEMAFVSAVRKGDGIALAGLEARMERPAGVRRWA